MMRITKLFYISLILGGSILIFLINRELTAKIPGADYNLEVRGIETPIKLLFNGYLGVFFNFKYHSFANWVLVPLIMFYYYLRMKTGIIKINEYEKFILIFLIISVILIGVKGYFNYRYSYTLVALVFGLIFWINWEIGKISRSKTWSYILVVYIVALNLSNFVAQVFSDRFNFHLQRVLNIKVTNYKKSDRYVMNIDTANAFKVKNVLVCIDTMNYDGYYIVNNLPDFYYYTNKKGYYYWVGDDDWMSKEGHKRLLENKDIDELKNFLQQSLQCRYIYTSKFYFNYNKKWDEFLFNHCRLVAYDAEYRLLYEING
ncbi:MAG: hypothetical protein KatS3mg027_0274 [Bacteroidia bacterium]|nr:MAG: hypothetical protein KatS3mg027_0274 [Bacteroidia bacterium]